MLFTGVLYSIANHIGFFQPIQVFMIPPRKQQLLKSLQGQGNNDSRELRVSGMPVYEDSAIVVIIAMLFKMTRRVRAIRWKHKCVKCTVLGVGYVVIILLNISRHYYCTMY